ncbi:DsbA family protein [Schaalia sp. 19OD2882]|uniref:DsbA family oxidoreductase n=1 Tax=Schaalia sp. 19OD2882 TaxID=2794089 RepID=UPI001C1EE25F|nr:DsbA family protein [Schaalia sp. 19OD2882]QWW18733.1 DsbA family protein [Schaalia sp. 19OD2882]
MRIDMWVDLGCPWSHLGFRHLRTALTQVDFGGEAEVLVHPYFLEPDLDRTLKEPWIQHLMDSEGMELEQALAHTTRLSDLGAAEGIRYDFARLVVAPTVSAHRTIAAARDLDMEGEATEGADTHVLRLTDALFRARFEMGLDLSDPDVLVGCAQDVGIDAEHVIPALGDEARASQVWSDFQMAMHMGVDAVPTLLLDDTFVVQGMQPTTALVNALTTAHAESRRN